MLIRTCNRLVLAALVAFVAACSDAAPGPANSAGGAGGGVGAAGVTGGVEGAAGSGGSTAGTTAVGTAGSGAGAAGAAGISAVAGNGSPEDAGMDAALAVDCVGEPAGPGPTGTGNRYDGLSEAQMFTVTQSSICTIILRCPTLVDDDPSTMIDLATCQARLGDMKHYSAPIDIALRMQLDTCVDDMERASCCFLKEHKHPPSCDAEAVNDLIDLK